MPAEEPVRSRANPLFKRLRALKERGPEGALCLLEGPKLVLEALGAGLTIVEAGYSSRAQTTPAGAAALEALGAQKVPLHWLSAELLASLSEVETSQGLVALARRPAFDEAQLYRATPLVVVADAIQNPGNLGGLLRTAEAAGATGAYLTGSSADPLSWKALRGSMGSAFRLPHVRGLDADAALDRVAGARPRRARDRGRRRAALRRGRPARSRRDRGGRRRLGALRRHPAARHGPSADPAGAAGREPQRRRRRRARPLRGRAAARVRAWHRDA